MCRIYGYFSSPASPHELRLVSAALRHGGPDAQSVVVGSCWGIGNNRLAITDPNGGDQPYRLGEIHVVFNGEIYNHNELRAALQARGYTFADQCDGTIIPALYLEYGLDFPSLLDGMFSIAIVDARHDPKLILATDDSGIKSLYYHWDPAKKHFYFASEIPALLSFRGVSHDLWLPGLEEYLATKTPLGGQTLFQHIQTLPPATTAVVDRDQGLRIVRRRSHYPAPDFETPDTAADELRQQLLDAVYSVTDTEAPMCVITGGGRHSQAMATMARYAVPSLGTYSLDAALHAPYHHQAQGRQSVHLNQDGLLELLPHMTWHLGQPYADPSAVNTWLMFRAVREGGYKVALTAEASDELLGGSDQLRAALAQGYGWAQSYLDSLAAIPRHVRYQLYTEEYRALLATAMTDRQRLVHELDHTILSRPQALTDFELAHRLPADLLRPSDHLSMAHGVEARLPFCLKPFVAQARALPTEYRMNHDWVAHALSKTDEANGAIMPGQAAIPPVAGMLYEGSALMTYAEDMLHADRLRRRGLLDPAAVTRLLDSQRSYPAVGTALAIWALLVFETWADQFGVSMAPVSGMATELLVI